METDFNLAVTQLASINKQAAETLRQWEARIRADQHKKSLTYACELIVAIERGECDQMIQSSFHTSTIAAAMERHENLMNDLEFLKSRGIHITSDDSN